MFKAKLKRRFAICFFIEQDRKDVHFARMFSFDLLGYVYQKRNIFAVEYFVKTELLNNL